jgi:hypothetical protein
MNHNNETLVQDFVAEPDVFFLGIKSLNLKSVAAARNRDQVLPIVGRHLYREIQAETCWNGGRINHSRSWMNFSLLPDRPMTSVAMVEAALTVVANNGIDWSKLRKDKIVGVELVISLPAAFQGDTRLFFVESLAWVRATFPSPITIIAAVVHLDEAAPHMHVILAPIIGPGAMCGHQVAGYKAVYNKRVNSFHQQVAQRYGLRKPRPKVKLTYRERQQLANRVLATVLADRPAWADNPAAVWEMRQLLTADPTPMAKALGLLEDSDDATPTAYAVAGAAVPAVKPGAVSTAFLCYAVGSDVALDGADAAGDDRADQVVEVAHQLDAASVLAGEAWLVLPTWQVTATAHSKPGPQAAERPIRIVLGADAGQLTDDGGDVDSDEGDFIRVREDQIPVAFWHDGQPMPLPAKPLSRRAQSDTAVKMALTNLTNPTNSFTKPN